MSNNAARKSKVYRVALPPDIRICPRCGSAKDFSLPRSHTCLLPEQLARLEVLADELRLAVYGCYMTTVVRWDGSGATCGTPSTDKRLCRRCMARRDTAIDAIVKLLTEVSPEADV